MLCMTKHFEDLLEEGSSKKMHTMTESVKEWILLTAVSLAFVFTLAVDALATGTCLLVKGIQKIERRFRGSNWKGSETIHVIECPIGER